MSRHTIAFLDDDHVIRLARYALSRPPEVSDQWASAFFAPEPSDLQAIYATGDGLHPSDGVSVPALGATPEQIRAANPAVIIFRRGMVDADLMAACPNLKLVQRMGERSDGIDLAAAHARGIHVSCMPRLTLIYTAEHAIMMMLALAKQLVRADAQVRAGQWDKDLVKPTDAVAYNWTGYTGLSGLYGKTLGIIGMGEVGAIMAGIARGFGMRVIYFNRTPLSAAKEQEAGVSYAERADLLAQSDYVSVNAANLPANRGMINLDMFKAMKRTAFFVNTSRGKLVNEDDLHTAVSSGLIAGAGLDVHWEEPRLAGDKLYALPNVIMTPHYAGGSRFGVLDELKAIFANCRAVLAGGKPTHSV
jgi:phosphoglycerate dehydrogenase-like enzyme